MICQDIGPIIPWTSCSFYLGTTPGRFEDILEYFPSQDDKLHAGNQSTISNPNQLIINCPCKYCGVLFQYEGDLRQHLYQAHGKDYLAVCGDCGKVFFSASGYNDHIKLVHRREKFDGKQCPICGKYCPRESRLRTHMKSHSNQTHFTCPVCKKSYKHKFNLKDHICKSN